MINLEKVSEGVHYNLVPNSEDTEAWAVEIIRGEYAGIGFLYDNITIDGKSGQMSFRVSGVDLKDRSHIDTSEEKIEDFAFEVLEDIVKNSIANGSIELTEADSAET